MCGVKTNIVTSVLATEGTVNDSPPLPLLVAQTAQHFNLREVSADKGYSSRNNLAQSVKRGARPYIPFKSNTTGGLGPMTMWKRMYHFYKFQGETFLAHYHKRSNVESTFHVLSRILAMPCAPRHKWPNSNEALRKVLCHNICFVIQSMHELGISPQFAAVRAA